MSVNLSRLEIAITYRCNCRCSNCLALCTQAPILGDITLAQVQSILDHPWDRVALTGGEPTLHPQFMEICSMLVAAKPMIQLAVVSNGHAPDLLAAAKAMGFILEVSEKSGTNKRFSGEIIPYHPINVSPQDIGLCWDLGCHIPRDCGICFNHLGLWPCAPMAAAARVFHYHPAALTEESMIEAMEAHCPRCGFSAEQPRICHQLYSETWHKKLSEYGQ